VSKAFVVRCGANERESLTKDDDGACSWKMEEKRLSFLVLITRWRDGERGDPYYVAVAVAVAEKEWLK
jgi:hypothetical protein